MKHGAEATPEKLPECIEGPQAFQRFDEGMIKLLSVPHSTLVRREKAYRKKVDANPNRRGPKRKVKRSASRAPAS
jgi:hypothetical protein